MDDYDYDEGSDVDNWETEQVFRDNADELDFFDEVSLFEEYEDEEGYY